MNLLQFLDKQSDGRLVLFGIILIIVVAVIIEGIGEIVKYIKNK